MKKRIVGFTISAVAVVVVAVASFVSFKVYNANAGADKGVARLLLLPILSRHRSIRDSWLRQRKIWLANCILKKR